MVFQPRLGTQKTRWWHYILDEKWSHCFVVASANHGKTLLLDPLFWGVNCDVLNNKLEDILLLFLNKGCYVLEWEQRVNGDEVWKPRGLYSCVSFVKSILNYRGWCITPKGLYKSLLRDGAYPWGVK